MSNQTIKQKVDGYLETWAPNCGAPKAVFVGQFNALLREIFDEIERRARSARAHDHESALREVREELGVGRKL